MKGDTVILVHGLWMTGIELSLLQHRLAEHGFNVRRYRYGMLRTGLEQNRETLANFIAGVDASRLHIIGHSLGGVLALHTLQRYPDLPIDKVVCLGSPLVDTKAGRNILRFPFGPKVLGKTLKEAVLDQPLTAWEGTQAVGSVAGNLSIGAGRIVKRLPGPNDGAVQIEETRLPGIADHIVLRVSHSGLVLSTEVAYQSMWFLDHGEFRWAA